MEESRVLGSVRRAIPSKETDGYLGTLRLGAYGEAMTMAGGKGRYIYADEGSYWVATSPTNGTGIAGIAATGAFSDQETLLYVFNNSSVAEGKRVYLDYLKLRCTAAGASGTDVLWLSKIDNTDRIGTGGSAITPVSPNMDVSGSFSGKVQFGAVATAVATSAARLIGQGTLRITIGVVNDTYQWNFGEAPPASAFGAAAAADSTNVVHRVVQHCPVVLAPQTCFVFSVYHTSQTAASSYEFELGMWQR